MSRTELLEQLVEAARQIARQLLLAEMTIEDRCDADVEGAYDAMIETMRPLIHALDALPASPAPAPERTVTLAAMEDVADGEVCLVNPSGTRLGAMVRSGNWRRLGTVTLPLAEGGA